MADSVYKVTRPGGRSWGISTNVLDTLVGLNITRPKAAERILAACKERLKEPGTDCVYLYFGDREEVLMVERNETPPGLRLSLKEMRAKGFTKVEGHGS